MFDTIFFKYSASCKNAPFRSSTGVATKALHGNFVSIDGSIIFAGHTWLGQRIIRRHRVPEVLNVGLLFQEFVLSYRGEAGTTGNCVGLRGGQNRCLPMLLPEGWHLYTMQEPPVTD
jgi:hypothetical protein